MIQNDIYVFYIPQLKIVFHYEKDKAINTKLYIINYEFP